MPLYGTITNKAKEAFVDAIKGDSTSELWFAFGTTTLESKAKPSEELTDIEGEFQRAEATLTPGSYKLTVSVTCTTTGGSSMFGIFDDETDGNLLWVGYYNSGAASDWPVTSQTLNAGKYTFSVDLTLVGV